LIPSCDAHYGGEAHTSVVAVADADRKPAAGHPGIQIQHAEHLHAVFAHGIFLLHHANMAEAESFDQCLHDLDVRHGPMSSSGLWRGDRGQFLTSQLRS
jgi:hypothetical protein